MVSLLFVAYCVVVAIYMALAIVFARLALRGDVDTIEVGQLSVGYVRYMAFLLASDWRPPGRTMRAFKFFLRVGIVLINIVFYLFLYAFSVEDNFSGDLALSDLAPARQDAFFWMEYLAKVAVLLTISLTSALVARIVRDDIDVPDVVDLRRWRVGLRLVFLDVPLGDGFSRFLRHCARWCAVVAILAIAGRLASILL